jgi:hypothetical protein
MNGAPGLAQQGIIHRHHQGLVRGQRLFDRLTSLAKNRLLIKPVLRVKPVVGRPVLLVAVLRAQKCTDGVPSETNQMGQQMTACALKTLLAGKGGGRAIDEFF